MEFSLTNMLSPWQWAVVAAVPPAIIALYFLKLKRRPIEVPSTYLWHKSIEDVHVNSIWQRLRNSWLLLLQLLIVLLIVLTLLRPDWKGQQLGGERFIFLIDNSASMRATDVKPSRLEEAKRRVGQMIERMKAGDTAMVISFSDGAKVEQQFTNDRRQLQRRVEAIRPTQRSTSLLHALKTASGLANPGHIAEDTRDDQVAVALPAKLYILSDGKFPAVTGFSLGNLTPEFIPIGRADADNLAIAAFSVRRSEADRELYQALARVKNYGSGEATVMVGLYREGKTEESDNAELTIPAGEDRSAVFELGAVEPCVLRAKLDVDDDLPGDNEAYAIVGAARQAAVLLVTPGNEALEWVLQTDSAARISQVEVQGPDYLDKEAYLAKSAGGVYDLVIYDRCVPKAMPQANTMFLGKLPPAGVWKAGARVAWPQILPSPSDHPLMRWVELGDVALLEGTPLKVPSGGSTLIDTAEGPMMVVAPRERYEDVVCGFVIVGEDTDEEGKPRRYVGTNWPIRPSFPAFVFNLFEYLGSGAAVTKGGGLAKSDNVSPGKPVELDAPEPGARLRVRPPNGKPVDARQVKPGKFSFTGTADLGVYEVLWGRERLQRFAVNLFHRDESDIRTDKKPAIKIGYVNVDASTGWETASRQFWKVLLLLALAVLLLEWYIYNRRVYL